MEVSSRPPVLSDSDSPVSFKKIFSQKWTVFLSTFMTIFLAEMGDKTQITTLLMAAESHNPGVVFVGAGLALVLTSLLGVLLGQWLSTRVSPKLLERGAGMSLLLIGTTIIWDIVVH